MTLHQADAVHWAFLELERMGYVAHHDDDTWTVTDAGQRAAAMTMLRLPLADRIIVTMHIGGGFALGLDTG